MIRRCDDHGYFESDRCPGCGVAGESVLSEDRRVQLSKFCSGALRHFPDDAGIDLDDAGWTTLDALVEAAEQRYDWADRDAVVGVVATDHKGRFERVSGDGTGTDPGPDRIRAAYGHSVDVDLEATDDPVPDRLYHGTPPGKLPSIRRSGLRPIGRQYVHLSGTVEAARDVGQRHAEDPAILVIDADRLQDLGHAVDRRGEDVYTTDHVPPDHLSVLYEGSGGATLLDATDDRDPFSS